MSLPATVVARGGAWQRPGRLLDLGLGGACISLAEPISAGSAVALVIDAPHLWDPLEIDAVAVWSRKEPASTDTLVGVKFARASAATLRKMAELLETNLF